MGTVAAVLLGVIFLTSGATKLASPSWPAQARELGVSGPPVAATPWFEIVLGALLVAGVARRPLAAVGAATLVAFTGLIVLRLAQGRRPPCACFGRFSARPIGPVTVVRNLAFLALAGVAVAG